MKQDIQHFIQVARDCGIEVEGDLTKPLKGLYGFERDPRIDICNMLGLDWEEWLDKEIAYLENRDCGEQA